MRPWRTVTNVVPGAGADAGRGLPDVARAGRLPAVETTVGAGRGSAGAMVLVVACGSRLQPRANTSATQRIFTRLSCSRPVPRLARCCHLSSIDDDDAAPAAPCARGRDRAGRRTRCGRVGRTMGVIPAGELQRDYGRVRRGRDDPRPRLRPANRAGRNGAPDDAFDGAHRPGRRIVPEITPAAGARRRAGGCGTPREPARRTSRAVCRCSRARRRAGSAARQPARCSPRRTSRRRAAPA
jgi:hypothetical protein